MISEKEYISISLPLEFNVKQTLIVSDPCYKRDTHCAVYNLKAKKGIWKAYISKSDGDVLSLYTHHIDYPVEINNSKFKLISNNIGVDSGHCGIYSNEIYPLGDTGEYGDINTFYGRVCDINDFEIIDEGGVVCNIDDWVYSLYGIYIYKSLIALKIVFI